MRHFFTYSCHDVTLWHRILIYDVRDIILEKHSKKQSLFFRTKPLKCPAQPNADLSWGISGTYHDDNAIDCYDGLYVRYDDD